MMGCDSQLHSSVRQRLPRWARSNCCPALAAAALCVLRIIPVPKYIALSLFVHSSLQN